MAEDLGVELGGLVAGFGGVEVGREQEGANFGEFKGGLGPVG